MEFALTDDRRMLAETLSKFLADNYNLEFRHGVAMSDERFSRDMWKQFAELGIIGALFDEASGGFAGEGADLMIVFEALGRHLVVEPFLPTLMAGSVLAASSSHSDTLESVIAGETLVAFAHGEPQSRYELAQVETKAESSGDGWTLTGNKSVVFGGGVADLLVVSARTSGNADAEEGISLFLVKSQDFQRISFGTIDGYGAAEISLNNAPAQLIGEKDAAYAIIEMAVAKAITAVGAEALGAMEVTKDMTVEYMKNRKQFGVPIGKFQALQHRMADVVIEIAQMRSAVMNAAGSLAAPRVDRERRASACKHMCGTIGRMVAEEAIQIHGGMGMTWEYDVGHYSKHLTMIDHVLGDTDHHLERYISLGREN